MIIYKTTNLVNGKIYVGQHTGKNPNYLGSGTIISNAIKKHGRENFTRITLQECTTQEELNKIETFWIDKLNARNRKFGYNIQRGGNGIGKHSEETKKLLSEAHKGKKHTLESIEKMRKWKRVGKPHTEETKKKMSLLQRGKSLTAEHILNLSLSHKGNKPSEETRKKMSIASKGNICIKKDNINKMTKLENLQSYLDDGWILGRVVYYSEKQKDNISARTANCKWINKDGNHKRIQPEALQSYLNDGWILGMIKKTI